MKINKKNLLFCLLVSLLLPESLLAMFNDDENGNNQQIQIRPNQPPINPHLIVQEIVPNENKIPTGSVISFAGSLAPNGWLMCDGRLVACATYPDLYRVIGRTYTLNLPNLPIGQDLFCVPDMRGRVPVGVELNHNNASLRVTSNNQLGNSGGEEKHQLTEPELARHKHSFNVDNSGPASTFSINNDHVHPTRAAIFETTSTGGDQPHNNMQPYLILNYIIKH